MPYRAMFRTVITVALAFLAVGMWVRAVEPLLVAAQVAATQPEGTVPATQYVNTAKVAPPPERGLSMLIKGTLLLSFLLICMLLLVGVFASFREWVRFQTTVSERRKRKKTPYVDAWKLAGERMEVDEEEAGDEEEGDEESRGE